MNNHGKLVRKIAIQGKKINVSNDTSSEVFMATLTLGLDRKLPVEIQTAWGAEPARIGPFRFQDPFESKQDYFCPTEEDIKPLLGWMNSVGFSKLRRKMEAEDIMAGSDQIAEVVSKRFCLRGSPCGQINKVYLTAWVNPTATKQEKIS